MPTETMGQRIKTLREARGLSQAELGDLCGVSRAAVSLWEHDVTKNIKNRPMLALARALGTTQEYLLFGPMRDEDDPARRRRRQA